MEAHPQHRTIIIDEVQKLPELLPLVHALIERDKQLQFVLTGSSARKLKRSRVDLLAGRAVLRHLAPYMAAELGTRFQLRDALTVGMFPLVLGAPDPQDTLRSYAALYVREEVQMEGLVRNVGNFSRFLEVLAFSHGSVLNMANIARECEIGQKAVEGFLSIVEDLLLAFRVPIFTRRAQRATAKHPKFYYFDTGFFAPYAHTASLIAQKKSLGLLWKGLLRSIFGLGLLIPKSRMNSFSGGPAQGMIEELLICSRNEKSSVSDIPRTCAPGSLVGGIGIISRAVSDRPATGWQMLRPYSQAFPVCQKAVTPQSSSIFPSTKRYVLMVTATQRSPGLGNPSLASP